MTAIEFERGSGNVFADLGLDCVFHANWTAVPWQTGRLFHGKVDGRSDATRGVGIVYSGVDTSVKVG
jgi:hypothetical protein